MGTEKSMYDLLGRVIYDAEEDGLVKLATVVSGDPLSIQIGDVVYSSIDWVFYAPDYDFDYWGAHARFQVHAPILVDGTERRYERLYTDATESVPDAGELSSATAWAKSVTLVRRYQPGDVLAVVELTGRAEFLILCRVRRVM